MFVNLFKRFNKFAMFQTNLMRFIFTSIFLIYQLISFAQPGGENCLTATSINSIPFIGIGNTTSANDDYFENCPDVGNQGGAPDHVYTYSTGNSIEYIDVSLCENLTNYDSQLIVYEDNCSSNPIGCQEDGCQSPNYNAPYNSNITGLTLQANKTYYFVIDGYDNLSSGNYQINIDSSIAFDVPDSSIIPLVYINTYGQEIQNEPKISANMGIINNGNGNFNFSTDLYNEYDGEIGIEIRGSSSSSFPKKGYGLETRDGNGNNNNVPLFNMPSENDWVLHAPYSDKSLMRNFLSYYLGNKMYYYSPRTQFCELIINDQYKGVYLFTEKIKRDNGRVDISRLDFDDLAGDSLTGGYIIKIDKYTGVNNDSWTSPYTSNSINPQNIEILYHYPEPDDIAFAQKNYIQDYVTAFEDALNGPNFSDSSTGYRNFADINSFVDYFLLTEATKNVDGYRISTFLYKDKDSKGGKLHIGPPWDYNLGWGNANYCEGGLTEGWAYEFNNVCYSDGYQVPFWWEKMITDPEFLNRLNCRWDELRNGPFHTDSINNLIDSMAVVLNAPAERNFIRWEILSNYIWPNNYVGNNYLNEINYFKTWINDRLNWIDNNLPGSAVDCSFLATEENSANLNVTVFPNPFKDNFHIEINGVNKPKEITIAIFDINGKLLYEKISSNQYIFSSENSNYLRSLSKGLYLITISSQKSIETIRLVKN